MAVIVFQVIKGYGYWSGNSARKDVATRAALNKFFFFWLAENVKHAILDNL